MSFLVCPIVLKIMVFSGLDWRLVHPKAERWPSDQRILPLSSHILLFVTIDLTSAIAMSISFTELQIIPQYLHLHL